MTKKIITYGNPVLRMKSEEVKEINDDIKSIVKDLEVALSGENGIGLAAPQIGIRKRIVIIDLTKSKQDKKIVLINPKIIHKSIDVEEYEEGCLSVPEVWGNVLRPSCIKIKGKLVSGNVIVIDADGLYARVIQHEMDHLDGKLFIDYLSPADRERNAVKIEAILEKNRKELGCIEI